MPRLLTPKFLLRGFEISVLASLVGFGITLLYGNDLPAFLAGLGQVHWGWILVGLGLASLDWIGGGLRLWVCARHVYPEAVAQGHDPRRRHGRLGRVHHAAQLGAGPMTMYTMRRYGIPLPVARHLDVHELRRPRCCSSPSPGRSPLVFGAGQSLGQRGNVLGLSLYDLFLGSLTIIAGIGVLMAIVIFFPRLVRDLIHRAAGGDRPAEPAGGRPAGAAARGHRRRARERRRLQQPQRLAGAVLGHDPAPRPSHANKLLAGLRRAPRARASTPTSWTSCWSRPW